MPRFIQFKCTRDSRDNLKLHIRKDVQCFGSISESSSGEREQNFDYNSQEIIYVKLKI